MTIIQQSPRSSAFIRAKFPEEAEWGLPEQLMAAAVDEMRIANWQRGEGKSKDRPKPIERPGVVAGDGEGYTDHTGDIMTWEEAEDFLGWSPESLAEAHRKLVSNNNE